MKLKDYLLYENNDDDDNLGRSKAISEDEAKIFYQENKHNGSLLYRGIDDYIRNFYLTKPKQHTRESRNTENYYTLLFDNSKRWSQYPKRSKSLICATDDYIASGYGNVFVVIPKKGAKIGVCPERDIWESFMNVTGVEMPAFNRVLSELFEGISKFGNYSVKKEPYTFADLKKNFEIIDIFMEDFIEEEMENQRAMAEEEDEEIEPSRAMSIESLQDIYFYEWFADPVQRKNATSIFEMYLSFLAKKPTSMFDYIDSMLSPNSNDFYLAHSGDSIPSGRECWTDAECLLISADQFDDLPWT